MGLATQGRDVERVLRQEFGDKIRRVIDVTEHEALEEPTDPDAE